MPFDGKDWPTAPAPARPRRSWALITIMIAVTLVVWLLGTLIGPSAERAERALATAHWLFGFTVPAVALIWLATWDPPRRDDR